MPFQDGWQNLKLEERLDRWLELNSDLDKSARNTIYNFVISCPQVEAEDYMNFRYIDIRDFSSSVQERLLEGFFAVYNISPALLELRDFNNGHDISRN